MTAKFIAQIIRTIFGGYTRLGQPFGKGAFGIVLPSDALKVGNGVSQDYVDAVLDIYLTKLAEIFGGFTTLSQSTGGWVNYNGELVKESVIVALGFCEDVTEEQATQLHSLAKRVKTELYQDCVTTIVGGYAILVDKGLF